MKEKMEDWGVAIFATFLALMQLGDRIYSTSQGLESSGITFFAFLPVCFIVLAEQRRRLKAELKQINDQLIAFQAAEH